MPREAVLEWAMGSAPARDELPELEALLEKAYETDAMVIEAQAQLQQAQAAVERARMEVARKIVLARAQWETRRRAVEWLSDALKKSPDDDKLLQQYIDARARLAEVEMQLPFFVGQSPKRARRDSGPTFPAMSVPQPFRAIPPGGLSMPIPHGPTRTDVNPDVRKALQKPMDLNVTELPLVEFVELLKRETGVNFFVDGRNLDGVPLTLNLKSVTLAAVLQAVEDAQPDVCFVVRPYGILVTHRERAVMLDESQAVRAAREDNVYAVPVLPGPADMQPLQQQPPHAVAPVIPGPPAVEVQPTFSLPAAEPAPPKAVRPKDGPPENLTMPDEPRSNWPRRKPSAR